MKKKIVCILIGAFCLTLTMFCISKFKENYPQHASLVINGEIIDNENVERYHEYATLPMLFIVEKCGASVNWVDAENAEILYNNTVLTLSLSEKSLIEHEFGNELLTPVPGSSYFHCLVIDDDIILDNDTLRVVLNYLFNNQVEIIIDENNGIITITSIRENKTGEIRQGDKTGDGSR